eukprot:TRINITY_DN72710_c0_g1_i1.p1 TRINITY_DN72710_c0_g1~~TRINITY_DN72710_c0_g1_i1.p1  ORF type:complete len:207 (-),score=17.62 TRINITY_DN72710_c0_g1_i1:652-1248(-)
MLLTCSLLSHILVPVRRTVASSHHSLLSSEASFTMVKIFSQSPDSASCTPPLSADCSCADEKPDPNGPVGAKIFRDKDFKGKHQDLIADGKCHNIDDDMNDKTSSIKTFLPGVKLFSEKCCRRDDLTVDSPTDDPDILHGTGDDNWDNVPTSYLIPAPVQEFGSCQGSAEFTLRVPVRVDTSAAFDCADTAGKIPRGK